MKEAIIVHGWEGSPEEPMHNWLKKEIEKKGYNVSVPKMPNPSAPKIKAWVGHLKKFTKLIDEDAYLIGHSVGSQAVLRYVQTLKTNKKIKGIILIAPWMHLDATTIEEEGEEVRKIAKPWMETPINWKKVKSHCKNFVCIFSNNDPYVPLSDRRIFKNKLKAKVITLKNRGHFTESDNIKKLPEVLKFIK